MDAVDTIVAEVLRRLGNERAPEKGTDGGAPERSAPPAPEREGIPVEMSARHVHLTSADLKELFGTEEMPVSRMISQPGQYLSTLRVRLIGPKGSIENVAVLGPVRAATQIEISATDARALGIDAPVRLSGDIKGAASVYIQSGANMLRSEAAIIAKRHLHMLPSDAARYGVLDGQCVSVRALGARPLIFEGVSVRVTEKSALALHIDTDEANAAGVGKNGRCEIVGCENISAHVNSCSSSIKAPNDHLKCSKIENTVLVLEGKLLTEEKVRELCKNNVRELCVGKRQIVTPLARDTAKSMGLKLIMEENR